MVEHDWYSSRRRSFFDRQGSIEIRAELEALKTTAEENLAALAECGLLMSDDYWRK